MHLLSLLLREFAPSGARVRLFPEEEAIILLVLGAWLNMFLLFS